jgi:hypothetical protein
MGGVIQMSRGELVKHSSLAAAAAGMCFWSGQALAQTDSAEARTAQMSAPTGLALKADPLRVCHIDRQPSYLYIHVHGYPSGVGSQGQEELIKDVEEAFTQRGEETLSRSGGCLFHHELCSEEGRFLYTSTPASSNSRPG